MQEMTIEDLLALDQTLGLEGWDSLVYASEWFRFFRSGAVIWAICLDDHLGGPRVWHMLA